LWDIGFTMVLPTIVMILARQFPGSFREQRQPVAAGD